MQAVTQGTELLRGEELLPRMTIEEALSSPYHYAKMVIISFSLNSWLSLIGWANYLSLQVNFSIKALEVMLRDRPVWSIIEGSPSMSEIWLRPAYASLRRLGGLSKGNSTAPERGSTS